MTLESDFTRDGFVVLDALFTRDELGLLSEAADTALASEGQEVTRERRGGQVRATHGNHRVSKIFGALVASPKLLGLAERLLGGPVYVHQFKINAKPALVGDAWEWHQDFAFWHIEDGMPEPDALTVGIFLDEVHEFNGPLMFVPGSHSIGTIATKQHGEGWKSTLETKLKHQISVNDLRRAIGAGSIEAPKGAAGTCVAFHSNLLHGSCSNMSADSRRMILISYNRVDNALAEVAEPRPEFLASRDFAPLVASGELLLTDA